MNNDEQMRERVSALMDGELHVEERQAAVTWLLEAAEGRDSWERYHLIGEAMRRSAAPTFDPAFSSRVMAALEDEPSLQAAPPEALAGAKIVPLTTHRDWRRPAIGLALAASLGTAMVIVGGHQEGSTPEAMVAKAPVEQPAPRIVRSDEWERLVPPDETMSAYLVSHHMHTDRSAVASVMPYARLVSHDGR